MSIPIAVEAKFETDGSIRPLAFIWKDERVAIASLGRRWEQDGEVHFLVMSADEKVYELAFRQTDSVWLLYRRPEDLGGKHLRV